MAETNFEKTLPQPDVEKIAEAAKLHAETQEGKEMRGEELIKKAIQTATKTVPAPPSEPGQSLNVLTDYAAAAPEEVKQKIEKLLEMAANKGLISATEEAKKSSPFILDSFHDALAAKLYPYLKEKGRLK
jgi:hypothetical protein